MGRGAASAGAAASCCCFVILVVAGGLVGGAFKIVEPLQYGILQNTISKELTEGRVYTGGRYFVGLAQQFILFPRTRDTIIWGPGGDAGAVSAPVNPGQVSVQCSLSYSLNVSNIVQLYRSFGTSYRVRFMSLVTSALQQTFSNGLNGTDFYYNRDYVTALSLAAAQQALYPLAQVHDFQLGHVTLPSTTEVNILNRLKSNQQALTAQNVQEQININAQINVVVGQVNQDIALFQANQTQAANILRTTAAATAKALQLNSLAVAYQAYFDVLGFNNTELLQFLALQNARNAPSDTRIAVGFEAVNLWQTQ